MMTEIYAQQKTSSTTAKEKELSGNTSTDNANKLNNTVCKKRAGDKTDKKKQDKKRALKRL